MESHGGPWRAALGDCAQEACSVRKSMSHADVEGVVRRAINRERTIAHVEW